MQIICITGIISGTITLYRHTLYYRNVVCFKFVQVGQYYIFFERINILECEVPILFYLSNRRHLNMAKLTRFLSLEGAWKIWNCDIPFNYSEVGIRLKK